MSHVKFSRNGIHANESKTPKPKPHASEKGTQALAHPCARRSVARGMAESFAPPVRPRASFRARESDKRTVFLRVSGQQSCREIELPRGDSGHGAWRQFLLMPRLCDERARDLQAHRVHARTAGKEARRQNRVCTGLPASFLRAVSTQRRQAPYSFSGWDGLPAGVA